MGVCPSGVPVVGRHVKDKHNAADTKIRRIMATHAVPRFPVPASLAMRRVLQSPDTTLRPDFTLSKCMKKQKSELLFFTTEGHTPRGHKNISNKWCGGCVVESCVYS